MILRLIILIVLISLSVYKLVSWQLKKARHESERIINEYKTDEERTTALKELKRKNFGKAVISYFAFIIEFASSIIYNPDSYKTDFLC